MRKSFPFQPADWPVLALALLAGDESGRLLSGFVRGALDRERRTDDERIRREETSRRERERAMDREARRQELDARLLAQSQAMASKAATSRDEAAEAKPQATPARRASDGKAPATGAATRAPDPDAALRNRIQQIVEAEKSTLEKGIGQGWAEVEAGDIVYSALRRRLLDANRSQKLDARSVQWSGVTRRLQDAMRFGITPQAEQALRADSRFLAEEEKVQRELLKDFESAQIKFSRHGNLSGERAAREAASHARLRLAILSGQRRLAADVLVPPAAAEVPPFDPGLPPTLRGTIRKRRR